MAEEKSNVIHLVVYSDTSQHEKPRVVVQTWRGYVLASDFIEEYSPFKPAEPTLCERLGKIAAGRPELGSEKLELIVLHSVIPNDNKIALSYQNLREVAEAMIKTYDYKKGVKIDTNLIRLV
ncbi:hypothetical protein J4218_06550 [Candidatus Pacearchaeota archaeon]|nr:hypothetical protein [Candidatus Pacearchaeota archaeon]